ncbi:hypothetical protein ABH999_007293 [Bradyrhizobium yuanmingense]
MSLRPCRKFLGPRRQRERSGQRACHLHRGLDALDGVGEVVDRAIAIAAEILDRAAHRASVCGTPNSFGGASRLMCAAILEVDADGQVGRFHDRACVGEDDLEADAAAAEHVGDPEARRGQGFEAHRREQLRGAGIPWIGNDEGTGPLVQRAKRSRLVQLARHGSSPLSVPTSFRRTFVIRQICYSVRYHQLFA